MDVLGIDIGGSGIKGALVNTSTGLFTTERHRIATPEHSTPGAVAEVVAQITAHFDWHGPVGCTFPAIIKNGIVYSAANVDDSWINTDGQTLLSAITGCPFLLINDADAAGLAEMQFGAGVGQKGVVMILTFGTGIGSAVYVNGVCLPNTEFGHLEMRGKDAEDRASDRIRKEKKLDWEQWAERVDEYLCYLDALFSPDLFIIGGGVSKKYHKFLPLLTTEVEVVPAKLLNDAGIVGAAMAASSLA